MLSLSQEGCKKKNPWCKSDRGAWGADGYIRRSREPPFRSLEGRQQTKQGAGPRCSQWLMWCIPLFLPPGDALPLCWDTIRPLPGHTPTMYEKKESSFPCGFRSQKLRWSERKCSVRSNRQSTSMLFCLQTAKVTKYPPKNTKNLGDPTLSSAKPCEWRAFEAQELRLRRAGAGLRGPGRLEP